MFLWIGDLRFYSSTWVHRSRNLAYDSWEGKDSLIQACGWSWLVASALQVPFIFQQAG